MNIGDSSAVVTGGASGLGEATARLLAERGGRVVIVDMQDDKGEALAKEIDGLFVHADVTDADQVSKAIDSATDLAPLRALVNCAGIAAASRTIGRDGEYSSAHPLDLFAKIVNVNLVGTFNCIRLAATAMSRTAPLDDGERGAIVNTSSAAAFEGQIGQAAYAASKGGIAALTLPVARDLSVVGIRVCTIAPGFIDTPIYGFAGDSEEFKAGLVKDVVFPKRLGSPPEFARLVFELLTNSYMNGEVVRIDGATRMSPR